jgi:hypothetical protein
VCAWVLEPNGWERARPLFHKCRQEEVEACEVF